MIFTYKISCIQKLFGRIHKQYSWLCYGLETDDSCFYSGRSRIFVSVASRSALERTLLRIQGVPQRGGGWGSSPRVRRPWRETDHSPPPNAESNSEWGETSLSHGQVHLDYRHVSNNIGGNTCQVDYLVRTNVKGFQYNSDTPRFRCPRVMKTGTNFTYTGLFTPLESNPHLVPAIRNSTAFKICSK